jgi:hypothetical protein
VSDERKPFELEPDGEPPRRADRAPPKRPAAPPPRPAYAAGEPEPGEEVDERTVAERLGRQTPRSTAALGNPRDWPREVLSFPFGRPGPGFMVLTGMVLVGLDLLGTLSAVRFLAWTLKLLMLVYVLRAQFFVIGSSAAGRDAPEGWPKALSFDASEMWAYLRTLALFALLLVPGILLWHFDRVALGTLLLLVGSMYAAVVALGAGLADASLKWPWQALKWMGSRPLHLLVGSAGWWTLLASEQALTALSGERFLLVAFVALALRGLCAYMLLVSARVLGVMGRRWHAA